MWSAYAGGRLRHILLILPAVLPGLLRPFSVSLLQRLHQGLGVPLLTMRDPLWERAPVSAMELRVGIFSGYFAQYSRCKGSGVILESKMPGVGRCADYDL